MADIYSDYFLKCIFEIDCYILFFQLHVIVFYSNDNSTNTTDFFINQLLPVAEFMDDYVNIELIPFGRAKVV